LQFKQTYYYNEEEYRIKHITLICVK